VAVPDAKSNFNCNQFRFCKITPENSQVGRF
jgi:hypothetical protein